MLRAPHLAPASAPVAVVLAALVAACGPAPTTTPPSPKPLTVMTYNVMCWDAPVTRPATRCIAWAMPSPQMLLATEPGTSSTSFR